MRSYNFHALDGTTTLKPFLDKPYTVTGTTYADRIEAIHKDGSGSLVFASPNIVVGPGGIESATFTGLFHSSSSSASGVWAGIKGVALDIFALDAAWLTPGTSDDQKLLKAMLSKADTFNLSGSGDVAMGWGGNDTMHGNGGSDQLRGGDANDTVYGGSGHDKLLGEAGADTLNAGTGADTLTGGGGRDTLVGGTDASRDVFVFTDWLDSIWGERDTVANFSRGTDDIDLRAMDADENSEATNEAFRWSGKTADDHAVWWKATTGGVLVYADVSGDTVAEVEIFVKGVTGFGSGDVLL
jgi:hypothetical protein